jgi:hypothetical protein
MKNNTLRALVIILLCAGAIAWLGNIAVSQSAQLPSGRNQQAMAFSHDESHHHEHHGRGANRGMNELLGSTLLFSGVVAAVVVPSVLVQRRKRLR